ncbi:hypothetical protein Tco_0345640 [Tanacetum coccineum]
MIIGLSVPSSSLSDGKEIAVSGEKLWVILGLAPFMVDHSYGQRGGYSCIKSRRFSMHSGSTLYIQNFCLISFHEVLRRFSVSLLDMMNFQGSLDGALFVEDSLP